ncbi:hypothetical protein NEOLEDRAFT_1135774 [Neolentinus lepideus HHB14362 ss-1]|uniref:Uncharacterized protein n=1 Tax=Neolentinus lepideus HHB14362 ss-1 TaxID=1314782 RepID=A0A165RKL8_9AGAM|nr:hypothetical protein NEOLEDRAFT_1135774 [Neolentinus lepideus HHB14362 ss-1]
MAGVVAGPSKTSPFGTLLRRSKFASFDPSIAQVYTAFDGHAHRGNWGLKRSLPVNRRNAHVTVTEFDSREQQTVWKTAETQARWMKAWQELGVETLDSMNKKGQHIDPLLDSRTWESKTGTARKSWVVDSEFDIKPRKDGAGKRGKPIIENVAPILPNIDAMSEQQFELFLMQLRRLRPAFKAFMKKKALLGKVELDPLRQAQTRLDYHREFIAEHIKGWVNKPGSTKIAHDPHPFAGASYSHNTRLSTSFLTSALPGRLIRMKRDDSPEAIRRKDNMTYVTSFAGMTTRLYSRDVDGQTEVLAMPDGSPRHPEAGKTQLRLGRASLIRAPTVVDADESRGMSGTLMVTDGIAYNRPSLTRPNPHYPGTIAYSAQEPAPNGAIVNMMYRTYTPLFPAKKPSKYTEKSQSTVLTGLRSMLKILKPKGPEAGGE